ncbi:MAG: hypothetical protein KGH53_00540 [Candidatus Micrarchaeota archaeon]|nr:hypothetical protein [Candidatus Micrarchaeota archaeon]
MLSSKPKVSYGRRITDYDYDSQIKQDPLKVNNGWVSICTRIEENKTPHFLTFFAARPNQEHTNLKDRRPEILILKLLLDKLRDSGVRAPEITLFPSGSRVVYPDERAPVAFPLRSEPTKEIGFHVLESIDRLYLNEILEIRENLVSAKMKEVLAVEDPRGGGISCEREIFYDVAISLEGLDMGPIVSMLKLVRDGSGA